MRECRRIIPIQCLQKNNVKHIPLSWSPGASRVFGSRHFAAVSRVRRTFVGGRSMDPTSRIDSSNLSYLGRELMEFLNVFVGYGGLWDYVQYGNMGIWVKWAKRGWWGGFFFISTVD